MGRFMKIVKKNMAVVRKKIHLFRLRFYSKTANKEYWMYLKEQFNRTLLKNRNSLLPRTVTMAESIFQHGKPGLDTNVLCIGCRNTFEIEHFLSRGFKSVVGIDLFSEDLRIKIMDMHKMEFPDNQFGLVYSSHSLEHSYNIQKVVSEIVRVVCDHGLIAIEIPVRYKTTDADRYDLKNVDGLLSLFSPYNLQILWSEDLEKFTPRNAGGTPIIRVILRMNK